MFHKSYRLAPNADSLHKRILRIFIPSLPFYIYGIVSILYYFCDFVKNLLSGFFGFFGIFLIFLLVPNEKRCRYEQDKENAYFPTGAYIDVRN